MQAQRSVPPDMMGKDKFLIQSTIVPAGTTDVHITPEVVGNYSSCVSSTFLHWFHVGFSWSVHQGGKQVYRREQAESFSYLPT